MKPRVHERRLFPTLLVSIVTIGLLAALFAQARGLEVHVLGVEPATLEFARTLGLAGAWTASDLPDLPFDAIVDATNSASIPGRALDLVEPGRRVVYVGLAGTPSTIDTRTLALKDVTAVGILGGSAGLVGAIADYASGRVDPRPLVAATVSLDDIGAVLGGSPPSHGGRGPKIQVDPRGVVPDRPNDERRRRRLEASHHPTAHRRRQ